MTTEEKVQANRKRIGVKTLAELMCRESEKPFPTYFPTTLFEEGKDGDYIFQSNLFSAFELIASGKTGMMTYAPHIPVMRCYWNHSAYAESKNKPPFEKGQITMDYFKHEFYGPFNQSSADLFIHLYLEATLKEKYDSILGKVWRAFAFDNSVSRKYLEKLARAVRKEPKKAVEFLDWIHKEFNTKNKK